MKPLVAKAIVPVLMLAGGATAWGFALASSEPVGASLAWIDSPANGEGFDAGKITVSAHASAPGGVDQIELSVDDKVISTINAQGDEHLGAVTFNWNATDGLHELVVRGHAKDGWGQRSQSVTVKVGVVAAIDDDSQATTTTTAPDGTSESTGTETTLAPEETTTPPDSAETQSSTTTQPGEAPQDPTSPTVRPTVPQTTPQTTPPTTRPTTTAPATTTTVAPTTTAPAPSIGVSSSPTNDYAPRVITFTATGVPRAPLFTIKILAQTTPNNPNAPMVEIGSCIKSPCTA
ncbi:MAG: hypothetical protein KDB26_11525, partial [Microthrixaceae bacterium]|nr:hypothetical protein [Microthrixaceae bacterium]